MTKNEVINKIKENGFCIDGEILYTDSDTVYKEIKPKDESILTHLKNTNFANLAWLIYNPKICYNMFDVSIDENETYLTSNELQIVQLNDFYDNDSGYETDYSYRSYIYYNSIWYSEIQ